VLTALTPFDNRVSLSNYVVITSRQSMHEVPSRKAQVLTALTPVDTRRA